MGVSFFFFWLVFIFDWSLKYFQGSSPKNPIQTLQCNSSFEWRCSSTCKAMVKSTLVYIISDTEKSLEFEWTANHFVKNTNLHVILIGKRKTTLTSYLDSLDVSCEFVTDEDTPSSLLKVWRVFWILKRIKPSVKMIWLIALLSSLFFKNWWL